MDWEILYLEWTRDYYLEWTGVYSTWNEAHHGESDEEDRGETFVCQRVQNRAQNGGLARKPPSYVAVYLQNGILRNTHYSINIITCISSACFTYTVYCKL